MSKKTKITKKTNPLEEIFGYSISPQTLVFLVFFGFFGFFGFLRVFLVFLSPVAVSLQKNQNNKKTPQKKNNPLEEIFGL